MPFRPPLTYEELEAIQDRHPDDPDVRALLWEIRRLHQRLCRLHQLRDNFPQPAGIMGDIWAELMGGVAQEPCITGTPRQAKAMMTRHQPPKE